MSAIADRGAPRPDRRTVVVGGALIAAAAVPLMLGTRRRAHVLSGHTLAQIVPMRIGGWQATQGAALIEPDDPDQGLYDAVLQRTYAAATAPSIMLAVAYGMATTLNRHRPDICYPAQGFTIDRSEASAIALPGGIAVPVRRMSARRGERIETIAFWRRMGDAIPPASDDAALAIWRRSLAGEIPDGTLVRMSVIGQPYAAASVCLAQFAAALIAASSSLARRVLLGPVIAAASR